MHQIIIGTKEQRFLFLKLRQPAFQYGHLQMKVFFFLLLQCQMDPKYTDQPFVRILLFGCFIETSYTSAGQFYIIPSGYLAGLKIQKAPVQIPYRFLLLYPLSAFLI